MKNLFASFKINANDEEVYKALTESFTIELWTGYPAIMKPVQGTEFELWDGDICGINLEFIENQKIVQEWYFGEQKEGSIVTMTLKPKGKTVIVNLVQTNIPDEAYENIKKGWFETYMDSLKKYYK